MSWRADMHAVEASRAAQWVQYHSWQAAQHPHQAEYANLAWQWKTYETQQLMWASYYKQHSETAAVVHPQQAAATGRSSSLPPIVLRNGVAFGLSSLPHAIHQTIHAANMLQDKPYLLGGGHRRLEDVAYDCSSSASYVLIKAGLLQQVLNSSRFAEYGEPGEGRYLTVWVKPGQHVFVTICGLRLDTSGGRVAEGPRWRTTARSLSGFLPRHPQGL